MLFSIIEIDYSIFEKLRMLTVIELMILITLFMGLSPIFNRMRALESKINDIQYNLGKIVADVANLNHTYNYRDIKAMIENNNAAINDVMNFLNKNHGFNIRKIQINEPIKYLDYDP
jgi:hypothetical protein